MTTHLLDIKVYLFNVTQDQVGRPVPCRILMSSTGKILAMYDLYHEWFQDLTEFLECFAGGCLSENELRERLMPFNQSALKAEHPAKALQQVVAVDSRSFPKLLTNYFRRTVAKILELASAVTGR